MIIEDFPVLRSVVMAPIPKDEMNVWLTAVTGAQIEWISGIFRGSVS